MEYRFVFEHIVAVCGSCQYNYTLLKEKNCAGYCLVAGKESFIHCRSASYLVFYYVMATVIGKREVTPV